MMPPQRMATRIGIAAWRELRLNPVIWSMAEGTGDPADLTNRAGRIFLGTPRGADPTTIIPYQFNVLALRENFTATDGSNIASIMRYRVIFGFFDRFSDQTYGATDTQWSDVLEEIRLWFERGGSGTDEGKLLDAFTPNATNEVDRFITTNIADWSYGAINQPLPGNVAIYSSLIGLFETRENIVTGLRS